MKYVYSFGRIGEHNIVIARPLQMGTVKAAQCAATVSQQFSNVWFALMVGIEAGIPNLPKHDIRLGDITVSIPQDNHPGVVQYDFGRYEQDGFVLKESLDKPPPILISVNGSLEEDEIMNKRPLRKILKEIINLLDLVWMMFFLKMIFTTSIRVLIAVDVMHPVERSLCHDLYARNSSQWFIKASFFRVMELLKIPHIETTYIEITTPQSVLRWRQLALWIRSHA